MFEVIDEWLANITFWWWFGFAAVLLIAELLTFSSLFLWVGIGAILTGACLWLFPAMGFAGQLFVFILASLFGLGVGYKFFKKERKDDGPQLSKRGSMYVGKTYRLHAPISGGVGYLIIEDARWKVRGPDTPKGAHVKVLELDGVELVVEPVAD